MKALLWIAFVGMVVAQWYVPLSLVTKSETTLSEGKEFRFKTMPVDPTDPFRGKYITLDFEASNYKVSDTSKKFEPDELVFASIKEDSAGYAVIDSLYEFYPADETLSVVIARIGYAYVFPENRQEINIRFPFDRLYLEESKAPDAERIYWQNRVATDSLTSYAVVRIHESNAVLVDVMLNDVSIKKLVEDFKKDTTDR